MVMLFDNTLRDSGNVVGHGFPIPLTQSIIGALLEAGIPDIECGNCKGLGAYAKADAKQAPSDEEYFEAVQRYLSRGRIGMFMLAKLADKELVRGAADAGLYFLRVGADAGDSAGSVKAVAAVKEAGLTCRYSLMKGYVLSAAELAKEAKLLQDAGVDRITIMDSAGTMFPDQTTEYVKALKDSVTIPVGFHGHSNLGLSQANALAAVAAGADKIDCGLLGMARSAGNCATELAAATLKREGYLPEVDLFGLLHYLEDDLIPTMEPYHYHVAIALVELMLGLSGCHSSFLPMFRKVAQEEGVSLLKLIAEASTIDRKAPSESLLRDVAKKLREENGLDYDVNCIMVTPGGKNAIYLAVQAILNEGDEVMVLDPAWVSYEPIIQAAGGVTVKVKLDYQQDYRITAEALEAACTDKTRLIIINYPNNPTGRILHKDEADILEAFMLRHPQVYMLSDEVYEKLVYDGAKSISMGAYPSIHDRVATMNGFSKSAAMTGWRMGYLAAPKAIYDVAYKLYQHSLSCMSGFCRRAP